VYRRATDVDEALSLLAELGDEAKVLAGGQSLVPMLSAGLLAPGVLVDINRIGELDRGSIEDGTVRIGALVRHRALESTGGNGRLAQPLLDPAARLIGHAAVRNRGTLVGSIVHADPSGEWPAVAVALDARVRLCRAGGERTVPVVDFIVAPMTSDIEADELATEVTLPAAPPRTGASVQELVYRHGDYAIVGVVAQVSLDTDGSIAEARVALFGVDAVPVRAGPVEDLVVEGGPDAFAEASAVAQTLVNPGSDATASADYRRAMIPQFCRRALSEAYAGAGSVAPRE
jgi:carbon-monoxide dehydrogenase medium subunit